MQYTNSSISSDSNHRKINWAIKKLSKTKPPTHATPEIFSSITTLQESSINNANVLLAQMRAGRLYTSYTVANRKFKWIFKF